jgi:hypothetical protein
MKIKTMNHFCSFVGLWTIVVLSPATTFTDIAPRSYDSAIIEPVEEERVMTSSKAQLSGECLKAFLIAYESFKRDPDIDIQKRQIENYDVHFSESEQVYLILFFAKRLPNEIHLKGGETGLGRDVEYAINKKTYQIVEKRFFK